jgi:type III restriction enzyme
VSASELKEDDMIKLPIVLAEHLTQWQDTVSQAVATRKRLAALATEEPQYIRPLLLIQCENAGRSSDWQAVKQYLIESEHIAESEIAVQTEGIYARVPWSERFCRRHHDRAGCHFGRRRV